MSNQKRMKIMKKLFYSVLALAGILAVSCNKEIEKPVTITDFESVSTHTVTVRADFGAETRTAYANDKTFSWVQGDTIQVYTVNEETGMARVAKLVAQESGASVDFVGEVEDGFELTSFAVYTAKSSWLSWDENNFYVYLPGTTAIDNDEYQFNVDSDNPMSNVPLVGSVDSEGVLHFSTATGVLKFNLTDLPSEATYFELGADDGNMLQGYFSVDVENGTINREGGREGTYTYTDKDGNEQTARYSYSNLFYVFTPSAAGEATIYVPVPVGTLGAGATVRIYNEDDEVIFTKKTTKDITVTRNKVTELAALSAKVEWVSLGTGKFGDHYHFNADYDVDVEIQQNGSDPTEFRLVNPYAGYRELTEYEATGDETGPDPYLVFRILRKGERVGGITVTHDDLVYFDAYYTGMIDDSYGVDPFLAHPSRWSSEFPEDDWLRSIVVKYQADGVTPANVQLAPVFFWVTDKEAGRGYWSGDTNLAANNMIEIKFPGAERVDLEASVSYLEIADSTPAQATAIVEATFSNAIASAKIVIAADETKAAEALASGADATTVTAAGECEVKLPANAPSGDYYVFMQTTVAEGLTPACNQLIMSDKFYYNNEETDLGLDLSVLLGAWTGDIIRNVSGQYSQDTFSMTIEESDNPLSGDVLLTDIYGIPATIPVYGWFDGKTGTLTIAPDQPWAEFNDTYDVGMVDAQSPNKDLSFRYREDGTLYLQSCEFVAFYLYDKGTTTQSDYWWGYFYGNTEDYHLTMTKDDASSTGSAPAALKGTRSMNGKAVSKIGTSVREAARMR